MSKTKPWVGYVTGDLEPLNDPDLEVDLIVEALARDEIDATVIDWNEVDDLSRFDALLIRSPWDYHLKFGSWQSFLERAEESCICINPAQVIRWNMDKRYLTDLDEIGIPIVPTEFCNDMESLSVTLADSDQDLVVVKPVVSAGSRDTALVAPTSDRATALGRKILDEGGVVMVQPAVESVATQGEVAAVCLGESVSHWVRKGPLLKVGGGLMSGDTYVEDITPHDPEPERVAAVHQALDSIRRYCRSRFGDDFIPTYARLDTVIGQDGEILLLEAELFEPSLFLSHGDGSVERLVELLKAKLGRRQ